MKSLTVETSPSLALIKYWGKSDTIRNLPATSSLAVSLDSLRTRTTVSIAKEDQVYINEELAPAERFQTFFDNLRKVTGSTARFSAHSTANFPVAAGLASSSSGFAALALAGARLIDPDISQETVSALARFGSASAARSLFGGFTVLKRHHESSQPLSIEWPELRVIIGIVTAQSKPVSSRLAMERARETSPFYSCWLEEAESVFSRSLQAVQNHDLSTLGPLMRKSYLSMFSTMLTSTPPTFYWMPESTGLIRSCEELRNSGIEVWETMDAGPQVKMICMDKDLETTLKYLKSAHPRIEFLVSRVGGAPKV